MPRTSNIHAPQGAASVATDNATDSTAEAEPPQWLALDIVVDDGWTAIADAETLIRGAAMAMSGHPEFDGQSLGLACVALSSDDTVRALNRDHRAKDKPTNVLSFPAPEAMPADDTGRVFLGDVILAADTVLSEAREQAIPPAHHLQHLVIHGLLHLMGFDHEQDDDAEAMEGLEIEILSRLGIENPYLMPRTDEAT